MPVVTIADQDLFYVSRPSAESDDSLLFVHGAGGTHKHWGYQLQGLEGVSRYALDLPGHGRSGGGGRAGISGYGEVILRLLDSLDLGRATLVGHSMGGAIALDFALHYPDRLNGLILVGSGARLRVAPAILTGILSDFETTVDLVCDYAFGPSAMEQLKRLGRQRLLKTPPEVLHGDYAACDAFDVMERLGEVHCPTLVIGGTADRLTPSKYSIYLRDHIPGAELALVDAAGHMVMLEKPEVVSRAVSKFAIERRGWCYPRDTTDSLPPPAPLNGETI